MWIGLDNLNLALLRDGNVIASSESTIDNVEHIYWSIKDPGKYSLRVTRLLVNNSGPDEQYALAWSSTAVPEPATLLILLFPAAGWCSPARLDCMKFPKTHQRVKLLICPPFSETGHFSTRTSDETAPSC